MLKLICKNCYQPFFVKPYRKNIAKFCSSSCSAKFYFPTKIKSFSSFPRCGKNHWNWKNGKKINSQGYILIYSPEHPLRDNQKYVREHRLVMEKYLNRYLLKSEVVHHKDGNKQNNNIDNLLLYEKSYHDKISKLQRPSKKIKKICSLCKKEFYVPPSYNRVMCCSKKCGAKFRWITKGVSSFGR